MLLLLLFLLASSICLTSGNGCQWGGDWAFNGENCVVVEVHYIIGLTVKEAQLKCELSRGELYMPGPKANLTQIQSDLQLHKTYSVGMKYNHNRTLNKLTYMTGEPVKLNNLPMYTNNGTSIKDKECVSFLNVNGTLHWTPSNCNEKTSFICQMKPGIRDVEKISDICAGQGWVWHISKCVFYDKTPRSYPDAAANCRSQGGIMLNPDDDFMDRLTKDPLLPGNWTVGVKQEISWIFDKTQSKMSKNFLKRLAGPNKKSSTTYCSSLDTKRNKWSAKNCDDKQPSICEKKAQCQGDGYNINDKCLHVGHGKNYTSAAEMCVKLLKGTLFSFEYGRKEIFKEYSDAVLKQLAIEYFWIAGVKDDPIDAQGSVCNCPRIYTGNYAYFLSNTCCDIWYYHSICERPVRVH